MSTIRRIIEKRIGKGILSKKELAQWEKYFNEVLEKIGGCTITEYLTSTSDKAQLNIFFRLFIPKTKP